MDILYIMIEVFCVERDSAQQLYKNPLGIIIKPEVKILKIPR